MKVIVITGSIASGKSTVSNELEHLGFTVLDCDKIAKKQASPGGIAYKIIKYRFGSEYFGENGEIDRAKLGELIFSDPDARSLLNSITHPFILLEIYWRIFVNFMIPGRKIAIDVPLFYEVGMNRYVLFNTFPVILIAVTPEIQLQRLIERNSLTEEEAKMRIDSQMNIEEKKLLCDFIIENNGTVAELKKNVERTIEDVLEYRASPVSIYGLLDRTNSIIGLCFCLILALLIFAILRK